MIQIERARETVECIDGQIVDAVAEGSDQGRVERIHECDGKSGAEPCDAGNRPALRPAIVSVKELFEGNRIGITGHEIVSHVERREATQKVGIERIDLVAEIRSHVERLAVGITEKQLQAAAGMTHACFECVVAEFPMVAW